MKLEELRSYKDILKRRVAAGHIAELGLKQAVYKREKNKLQKVIRRSIKAQGKLTHLVRGQSV